MCDSSATPTPETSLDPEQKSVTPYHEDDADQQYRFRHSPQVRQFWLDHLPMWERNYKKVQRFEGCGSDAFVEYSPSLNDYRVRATHCGNRICPACQRAYAHRTGRRLAELFTHSRNHPPAFLTLTLKPSAAPLEDTIRHLKAFFRRLRATPLWKNAVKYGVAVVEVTRGKRGTHWHAHLHCIIWADFIKQQTLSDLWRKITCGSFIVDIRRVKSSDDVTDYMTSYLTKPPPEAVMLQDTLAEEWYRAVTAQHWVIRFGSRKLLPPKTEPVKARDWERVCSLQELLAYADQLSLKEAAAQILTKRQQRAEMELLTNVLDSA